MTLQMGSGTAKLGEGKASMAELQATGDLGQNRGYIKGVNTGFTLRFHIK